MHPRAVAHLEEAAAAQMVTVTGTEDPDLLLTSAQVQLWL